MIDNSPLWTRKYRPDLDEFSKSGSVVNLESISDSGINCLLIGPKGVGKTALSKALSRNIHSNPEQDTVHINVSDIFDRTKKQIKNDKRFSSFVKNKRDLSKNEIINEVLKEISSYPPVTGGFKTIILDNMESSRDDFQRSLRRIMERNAENTQFILTSRENSMIPAIESRCQRVYVRPPSSEFAVSKLEDICESESVNYRSNVLNYIWSKKRPNMRKSILTLQTTSVNYDEVNPNNCKEIFESVENKSMIRELFKLARNQEFSEIESKIDDLIYEEGYDVISLLEALVDESVVHLNNSESRILCKLSGEASINIEESNDPRIEIKNLLAKWSKNI